MAIAVIDKSYPHFHKKTKEVYKVIKGKLTLFIENKKFELKENQKIEIPPKKIHWATGKETWVECFSTPGWKVEDHILMNKNFNVRAYFSNPPLDKLLSNIFVNIKS